MPEGYLVDVFDLLNVRDLDLIAQASDRCSALVVGVCSDDYAEELMGRRPVVPEHERMALVGHLRGVTEVVAHEGDESLGRHSGVLFVAEDRPALYHDDASVLRPLRQTRSPLLQNALRPMLREDVA